MMLARVSLLLALSALAAACGPTSRSRPAGAGDADIRSLSEHRALELVHEVLREEGIPRGPAWTVPIDHGRSLDVDVRLAQSSFGVEWVSPQDRADLGDAVPGPTADGRLRIVPGAGDSRAEVLVLEHSTYEYANEREHVQGGVVSAAEAESRLRRDLRDFLHYVRGQGGL